MDERRKGLYKQLENLRESKVITYVTGTEAQIGADVVPLFVNHLDLIGETSRVSLYLHTSGGDTIASWSVANLLRQFCSNLEVIVPFKAHSGGTLISLAANEIVMTRQATLSPIDPAINGPLNPTIDTPDGSKRVPVSVEAINGYVEFAKNIVRSGNQDGLKEVLSQISSHVHPLVLGSAYRVRSQIRMLGRRLASYQVSEEGQVDKLLDFLCSDSGSHDYVIYHKEAKETLGLNVSLPSEEEYEVIKRLYQEVSEQVDLGAPFDPRKCLNGREQVEVTRVKALVESLEGGSDLFEDGYRFKRFQVGIQRESLLQEWRHEE